MAETRRTTTRRTATGSRSAYRAGTDRRNLYDTAGSAVPKPREIPERRVPDRREIERRRAREAEKKAREARRVQAERRAAMRAEREARPLSSQTQRNRQKAAGINRGFVMFIAVICVAILGVSVYYLQLKSEITASIRHVATLEAELNQLREDNDAYYSQVTSDVDMSMIKKIAIGRLGMKYPSEGQTETYTTARTNYMRQYQDIPDSK